MRRALALLSVLAVLTSFTACTNPTAPQQQSTSGVCEDGGVFGGSGTC